MKRLKKNVQTFNRDIEENKGYKYSDNKLFSSIVSNKRINRAIADNMSGAYKSMLDIGCGDGTFSDDLRKTFPAIKMSATDPASNAVALGEKKYEHIKFFVSNILDEKTFNKQAGQYDVALLRGVLHHLNDPTLAIKNALKLADNLIIVEPNGNNPILKYIERTSQYHIEHQEQSFSLGRLKRFCAKATADIKTVEFINYVPFFFPELPSKIIYFFQPFLERIPSLRYFFSGQIIITCVRKKTTGNGK